MKLYEKAGRAVCFGGGSWYLVGGGGGSGHLVKYGLLSGSWPLFWVEGLQVVITLQKVVQMKTGLMWTKGECQDPRIMLSN